MPKFCPSCGKSISKGVLCKDCSFEELDYKELNIKLCLSKKYFYKGKWTNYEDLFELTKKLLEDSLNKPFLLIRGLEEYEELLAKPGIQRKLDVLFESDGIEYEAQIGIETTLSPSVAKVGSEYYEGILQLRNARDEIKKYIASFLVKNNIYINKKVDKDDSVDYYFIDKRRINTVSHKVMKKFGGVLDLNEQLFSRNRLRSKDLFRLNALLFVPSFKEGDVVLLENPVLITNTSKLISGFDLVKGKKMTFNFERDKKYEVLKINKAKVISNYPEFEVISPTSYESLKIVNNRNVKVVENKNVKFVEFEGKAFVI